MPITISFPFNLYLEPLEKDHKYMPPASYQNFKEYSP